MITFSQQNYVAQACGKTILIGEHAVVYGHQAVAMALPDVSLTLTLHAGGSKPHELSAQNWNDVWDIWVLGKKIDLALSVREQLVAAFEKALSLCGEERALKQFTPQRIEIQSQIPLGGGLGGSAAISLCLLKVAALILKKQFSFAEEVQLANEVDCMFHDGRASGLDVTAIASRGMIGYCKEREPKFHNLANRCRFWLSLIDSRTRSETSQMIKTVALRLKQEPARMRQCLESLGELTQKTIQHLEHGLFLQLCENLNQAHICLQQLGVSTHTIDQMIACLKENGALAAKLTGGGGGGFVLAIFDSEPTHLESLFPKEDIFITRV